MELHRNTQNRSVGTKDKAQKKFKKYLRMYLKIEMAFQVSEKRLNLINKEIRIYYVIYLGVGDTWGINTTWLRFNPGRKKT